MKYDLNIGGKQLEYEEIANKQYKAIKKRIGKEIFFYFNNSLKDHEGLADYYSAKELYETILKEDCELLNLKRDIYFIPYKIRYGL